MSGKFEPTPEQLAAINHKSGAAIVSAAAGSGKTAVLVDRVIKLLLDENDHINADEMVITTFTVKAAGEMKERLVKALNKAADKEPENALIAEQLLRLGDASISTINSFCLSLLRKYGAVCGLNADLAIADEAEATLYMQKALDMTVEEFCEKGSKKDKRLIYDCFSRDNDIELADTLKYVYNFSRTLPDEKAFFSRWLSIYEKGEYPKELLEKFIEENIKSPLKSMETLCEELSGACEALGMTEKHVEIIKSYEQAIALFDNVGADGFDYGRLLATCGAVTFPRTPNAPKGMKNDGVTKIRGEIKKVWEELLDSLAAIVSLNDDIRAAYPVLKVFVRLMYRLDEIFTGLKREKNKLDFSDVELIALKMLRNEDGSPSDIAKEIAASVSIIIVDEFQDSNAIQYEIFRLISRDKENLYFVGDIKQSIYAFRGADPSVFSRLAESGEYKVLPLNRNFRSCKEVIDSVNGVFMGSMTKETGGVDYDGSCALVEGKSYATDERNITEFIPISGDNAESAREAEAAYIADRIKEMVNSGFEVTNDDGTRRPCGYGDFAVLMGRYSNNVHIYKRAFRNAGVPFDARDDENYTSLKEIKLMCSLLRVIDNPYNDYELATVMMCPPYMFTPDEMAEIRLADKSDGKKGRKSLFSGLRALEDSNEKAREFLESIRRYREFAAENTTEQLIRMLYDECPLIPAMKASPNGERRDTNLKKLIGHAASFERRSGGSLYDFLAYMKNLEKGSVKMAQAGANSGDPDCVKMMTIHNSKGLEFPICFVANLTSEAKNTSSGKIVCDADYGVGVTVVEPKKLIKRDPLAHRLITGKKKRLERSESMRLLYVALTRAKEKLIITAPVTPKTKDDMHYGWVKNSRAVKSGLISVHPLIYGYKAMNDEGKAERESQKCELSGWSVYGDDRLCKIPSKVTATQIGVKSVDDFSDYDDKISRFMGKPSFLAEKEEEKLNGKKLGDAYHKAMERLDFSGGGSTASKQLDALLGEGRLTRAERASIDDSAVAAFLDSDVCVRAVKSGSLMREYPIFCELDAPLLSLAPPDSLLRTVSPDDGEKPFIQGVVDMFFIEEDGVVLVDYKTNRVTAPEQLIEEYSGQLAVYAYALERMTGKPVKERVLYSFCLGKEIPVQ